MSSSPVNGGESVGPKVGVGLWSCRTRSSWTLAEVERGRSLALAGRGFRGGLEAREDCDGYGDSVGAEVLVLLSDEVLPREKIEESLFADFSILPGECWQLTAFWSVRI